MLKIEWGFILYTGLQCQQRSSIISYFPRNDPVSSPTTGSHEFISPTNIHGDGYMWMHWCRKPRYCKMFSKGKLQSHLYNDIIVQNRYQLKKYKYMYMYFFSITCTWSTCLKDLKRFYYLHVSLFVYMFLRDKTFLNMYKANTCTVVNALKY